MCRICPATSGRTRSHALPAGARNACEFNQCMICRLSATGALIDWSGEARNARLPAISRYTFMTTADPTPDESLTYRLKALGKIADRMSSELSRGKLGLPMPEAMIIGVLGAFGPQTVMDISRRSNLDKSQASRTTETLIGKGLLSRTASNQDGRSVIISLMPEGRKIFRKIAPMVETRDKELYRCLSEPEMDALRYLLDKLLESHGWQAE